MVPVGRRYGVAVAAAAALAGSQLAAAAPNNCQSPPALATVVAADAVRIAWQVEADSIVVGQPFVLLLEICPVGTRLLRLDASMPEHRHGMNYRPLLLPLGEGRWRIEGLLWHMPGRWEMVFELDLDGRVQQLRSSVSLR